jgi:hypothetical protein
LAPPDCNVDASEFSLQYVVACSALQNHDQGPPNPNNVAAAATINVYESLNRNELPLIVGAFALVQSVPADAPPGTPPDPQQQFAPFLPAVPQQAGSGASYQVRIPVAKIRSGYLADEYPCQLIVLTNGGARYVSLGEIPAPTFDKRTGYVTNGGTLYINDCHFGRLNPYAVIVSLLNLVDPPPEGVVAFGQAVERAVVEGLSKIGAGGVLPVTVGGRQVGTVSVNSVMENQISHIVLSGAAGKAGAVASLFVQRTAGARTAGVFGNEASAGAKTNLKGLSQGA